MDIDPKAVGSRIKAARIESGMSRAELAQQIVQRSEKKGGAAGIKAASAETIRLWEIGKVLPPQDKLVQLARVLKLTTQALLFDSPPPAPPAEEGGIPPTLKDQEMLEDIMVRRLVEAFRVLPQFEKDDVVDSLELKALQYRTRKKDAGLAHLARPDSEIAKAAAEKLAKSKNAS